MNIPHLTLAPAFAAEVAALGWHDAAELFSDRRIKPWRILPDRENCTLDFTAIDGWPRRWHVKRGNTRVADEAGHIGLLVAANIPTMTIVAHGKLPDGRGVLITEDLAGYADAEKLVAAGTPFEALLEPMAKLAAALHAANLHHRDLYLCHFFASRTNVADLRLIDCGRVAQLPRWFARRWIVKDLAQFIYSTTKLLVSDEQRHRWLEIYAAARPIDDLATLRPLIDRKIAWIARHDARLNRRQPTRNVALTV